MNSTETQRPSSPAPAPGGSPRARADAAGGLQAVGLECIRDERVLFSDLSFAVAPGGILQVEGPNGSGKTSLLRILCGLSRPERGEVRWCGRDIRDGRMHYLAEVHYLGHASAVKAELTALENLRVAGALAGACAGAGPGQALARVGLYGYEDVPASALSAGQRRRLALARLLVTAARLWILDEPFTAIDAAGRRDVEALLREHAAAGGLAVITSHHAVRVDGVEVAALRLGS